MLRLVQDQASPMRVGFATTLVDGFEDVEWFGRGPHESYLDRYASARVGVHQGSILEQTVKYVRPQEMLDVDRPRSVQVRNGNKFETRWMALKRKPSEQCDLLLISAEV